MTWLKLRRKRVRSRVVASQITAKLNPDITSYEKYALNSPDKVAVPLRLPAHRRNKIGQRNQKKKHLFDSFMNGPTEYWQSFCDAKSSIPENTTQGPWIIVFPVFCVFCLWLREPASLFCGLLAKKWNLGLHMCSTFWVSKSYMSFPVTV